MIDFTLGMPVEEYIRKHKKLLDISTDRMKASHHRHLDLRRLQESLYMFYVQIPNTLNVTLHLFVFSAQKKYRLPTSEDTFEENPAATEIRNNARYEACLAVGFDTLLGKYIYFSSLPWLNGDRKIEHDRAIYNLLLSPRFLEEYQNNTPRGTYLNVLHKFIAEEYMGDKGIIMSGLPCHDPDYGYRCVKGYAYSSGGLSLGNFIGDFEAFRHDLSKGVLQLNSFTPMQCVTKQIKDFIRLDE